MADVQTNLRIPAELKEALLAAATRNNRSLSAEVIFRLVHSFSADAGLLQDGEPEELRRERDSLHARLEVTRARLAAQEGLADVNSSQAAMAHDMGLSDRAREMEHRGVEIRKDIRHLREMTAGIEARLREIESDLKLPEWPEDLVKLANKMPR